MNIPKPMIKCCRLIVLIWFSVVLPFHKCLRLLRLGLFSILICWDATITKSIWLMNRKTFVNDTLSLRGTENYCLENAWLFSWKLLSYSLTALERRNQFWSMSHLVSENKSIYYYVWRLRKRHETYIQLTSIP